jgi:hypothetical protein
MPFYEGKSVKSAINRVASGRASKRTELPPIRQVFAKRPARFQPDLRRNCVTSAALMIAKTDCD